MVETFGALDFAHNNAGIEVQKTVLETTVEDYDRVQAVNAKGVFLGLKSQLPIMKAQGSGAIVNTASLLGLVGLPGLAAYVASKHAVVGLTKVAAIEHAGDGIRVNSVCPAATGTEMMLHLPPERQADLVAPQAIKRIADPNEIAEVVVWLASDRASFITGANIPADAGATAM